MSREYEAEDERSGTERLSEITVTFRVPADTKVMLLAQALAHVAESFGGSAVVEMRKPSRYPPVVGGYSEPTPKEL